MGQASDYHPFRGDQTDWKSQGRRPNKGSNRQVRRTGAIVGTKTITNSGQTISGGPLNIDIKIWNVTPTCESQHVREAIEDEGVEIKGEIEELSKPGWRTKSFKVCIGIKDKDHILKPEVWPSGVKCGIFWPARKPRNSIENKPENDPQP
jgi:hypothetical protein